MTNEVRPTGLLPGDDRHEEERMASRSLLLLLLLLDRVSDSEEDFLAERGHRASGVVYHPECECRSNCVRGRWSSAFRRSWLEPRLQAVFVVRSWHEDRLKAGLQQEELSAMLYRNREDAGRALARALTAAHAGRPDVIVLALPRGGVPVGAEVARALGAPLDVLLVRKLGVPGHEELAMGAIADGGVRVVNEDVLRALRVPVDAVEAVALEEGQELQRRARAYRGGRPAPDLRGRTVILVDDGLATGSTMRAAVAAVRRQGPARVVVAVPVGAEDTCEALRREADEVVCPRTPEPFYAVGAWYRDFLQTTDEEVRELLARAAPAALEEQHAALP
jgi:predicted phosphoribosyltransferase